MAEFLVKKKLKHKGKPWSGLTTQAASHIQAQWTHKGVWPLLAVFWAQVQEGTPAGFLRL